MAHGAAVDGVERAVETIDRVTAFRRLGDGTLDGRLVGHPIGLSEQRRGALHQRARRLVPCSRHGADDPPRDAVGNVLAQRRDHPWFSGEHDPLRVAVIAPSGDGRRDRREVLLAMRLDVPLIP